MVVTCRTIWFPARLAYITHVDPYDVLCIKYIPLASNHDQKYLFPPGSFLAELVSKSLITGSHRLTSILKTKPTRLLISTEMQADAF